MINRKYLIKDVDWVVNPIHGTQNIVDVIDQLETATCKTILATHIQLSVTFECVMLSVTRTTVRDSTIVRDIPFDYC